MSARLGQPSWDDTSSRQNTSVYKYIAIPVNYSNITVHVEQQCACLLQLVSLSAKSPSATAGENLIYVWVLLAIMITGIVITVLLIILVTMFRRVKDRKER